MEFLTTDFIRQHLNDTAYEEEQEFYITADALEFIRMLISPYIMNVNNIRDSDVIVAWIDQVFQPAVVNRIRNNFAGFHLAQNYPLDLITGKKAVIRGILDEIMDDLIHNTDDLISVIAFDILDVFQRGPLRHIIELWGFLNDELPVKVTISNNTFTHNMSFELILGIIIFYQHLGLNHPLTLFESRLEDYDRKIQQRMVVVNEPLDYLIAALPYTYIVRVRGRYIQYYSFFSLDFIRGLTTAAEWNNLNVHDYVDNLGQQHYPMNQRLQF